MRSIKFRAWDKKDEEMIDVARFDFADFTIYSHLFVDDGRLAEDCHIMQYTGLKDKNGKEIYEQDIVKYGHKSKRGEVIFERCTYVIKGTNYGLVFFSDIEVIGNIYEHPHLLEGAN